MNTIEDADGLLRRLVTVGRAAELCGFGRRRLYRAIERGEVQAVQIGGVRFVDPKDVAKLAAEKEAARD